MPPRLDEVGWKIRMAQAFSDGNLSHSLFQIYPVFPSWSVIESIGCRSKVLVMMDTSYQKPSCIKSVEILSNTQCFRPVMLLGSPLWIQLTLMQACSWAGHIPGSIHHQSNADHQKEVECYCGGQTTDYKVGRLTMIQLRHCWSHAIPRQVGCLAIKGYRLKTYSA